MCCNIIAAVIAAFKKLEEKRRLKKTTTSCLICMDSKPAAQMFRNNNRECEHLLCRECTRRYVETKIGDDDNALRIYCPVPECRAVLEPQLWRSIVPQKVFDRWENRCRDAYQKPNNRIGEKEDKILSKLAKRKRWRRCPACKFYIEKSSGCSNMICRCGCVFCYECGSEQPHDRCRSKRHYFWLWWH